MEEFKDAELELDARQIIPLSPWSAIARGAVTHGLNPKGTVESRKCRWSYGICVHQKFDPAVDGEDDAFECPVNGKRAFGHMKWHAKRVRLLANTAAKEQRRKLTALTGANDQGREDRIH